MSEKVSFVKWSKQSFNTFVHMGSIATAQLLSKPYLNEWGETVCDVFWDNYPFASPLSPVSELAMYLHLKKCACNCGCGNLAEVAFYSPYMDGFCNDPCISERHDLPQGTSFDH